MWSIFRNSKCSVSEREREREKERERESTATTAFDDSLKSRLRVYQIRKKFFRWSHSLTVTTCHWLRPCAILTGLPENWRTLYPLYQWTGIYIYIHTNLLHKQDAMLYHRDGSSGVMWWKEKLRKTFGQNGER